MKVDEIIAESMEMQEIKLIRERCSEFLQDSRGLALFKNLSTEYAGFQKIKVRTHKTVERDDETFNEAFVERIPNIRQRAIFANGSASFEPDEDPELEPFYIFPIDGYKFLYSPEVENSSKDYKHVFHLLLEEFGEDNGKEIILDMLKFTYKSEDLMFGIQQGCEIIIYSVPYYYAIRVSSVKNYSDLLSGLLSDS